MPNFMIVSKKFNDFIETNYELTQDVENLQDELNVANEKILDLEQRVSALESASGKGNGSTGALVIVRPAGLDDPFARASRSARQSTYKHLNRFR